MMIRGHVGLAWVTVAKKPGLLVLEAVTAWPHMRGRKRTRQGNIEKERV
ncbi:MAG: hypothetical protein WED04_03185 [Promethearchaeati archaeon SRVP18_Atabeyarchaeia-1]